MIYESEEFSLLLNLFGLDVTSEKLPFSDIRKLLFIEKEDDEINELDLDENDFDLTKDRYILFYIFCLAMFGQFFGIWSVKKVCAMENIKLTLIRQATLM